MNRQHHRTPRDHLWFLLHDGATGVPFSHSPPTQTTRMQPRNLLLTIEQLQFFTFLIFTKTIDISFAFHFCGWGSNTKPSSQTENWRQETNSNSSCTIDLSHFSYSINILQPSDGNCWYMYAEIILKCYKIPDLSGAKKYWTVWHNVTWCKCRQTLHFFSVPFGTQWL